jgi:hypothetical protein
MFGADENQVDPVRHLNGTAMLWGGNPEKDALYLLITPTRNDGDTIYRLTIKDVPVDGFWSITVYNSEGYLQPNPYQAYALNSLTAQKSPGRCDQHPVRRLRRQDSQLPADHEGLELHRATVPPASGDPERHMEIPGDGARGLTLWPRGSGVARGEATRGSCWTKIYQGFAPSQTIGQQPFKTGPC